MARISEEREKERKPEATSRPDIREHVVIGQYLVESIRKKKEVFKINNNNNNNNKLINMIRGTMLIISGS